MTSISVEGVRGGIGTSTFTWAIARELPKSKLFDISIHQGLAWVTGYSEADLSWPEYVSQDILYKELFAKMKQVEGVSVFSGGSPFDLAVELLKDTDNIVIDGSARAKFRILHTTNSIRDLKALEQGNDFDLVVLRKIRGGIPLSLVSELKIDFSYNSENSVHRTISNGYGLHHKSRIQKVAKEICAELSKLSTISR
jgi:hypothetical protein